MRLWSEVERRGRMEFGSDWENVRPVAEQLYQEHTIKPARAALRRLEGGGNRLAPRGTVQQPQAQPSFAQQRLGALADARMLLEAGDTMGANQLMERVFGDELRARTGMGERHRGVARLLPGGGIGFGRKPARVVREGQLITSQPQEGFVMSFEGEPITEIIETRRAKTRGTVKPTPGMKKRDEKFAQSLVEFEDLGGATDVAKQISQLRVALGKLESGENLTGPILGSLGDTLGAVFNPEGVAVQELVAEVTQRNLRAVLGGQFAEREGDRLIARAFNPRLGEKENARRVRRLLKQMEVSLKAKQQAADYFYKNKTLEGYRGPRVKESDFLNLFGPMSEEERKGRKGAMPEVGQTFRDSETGARVRYKGGNPDDPASYEELS